MVEINEFEEEEVHCLLRWMYAGGECPIPVALPPEVS